jgi:queuine/archaeosine tRNA-ribosyltransferase
MMLERRAVYCPAVGPQFYSYWKKDRRFNGRDYKWFTVDSLFRHPYTLVSFAHKGKDVWWWRDEVGYDGLLLGDSGGFQISKGKDVCLEASLRWQEEVCDIGFILDVPPVEDFNASLKKTTENSAFFEKKRWNYDMKFYNVLHGNTLERQEIWFNAAKDFDFDGWSLGIKDNHYLRVLAYLLLHENEASNLQDNFHVLGTSSLDAMLVLSMLSKHFKTGITFDSATYSKTSAYRIWYQPLDIQRSINIGRNAKTSMTFNPCHCPVCSQASIKDLQSEDATASLLIALHNLYQFKKVNETICEKVEDEEALETYAMFIGKSELIHNINGMFEEYEHGGYGRVYEKYRAIIEGKQKERTKKAPSSPTLQAIVSSPVLG